MSRNTWSPLNWTVEEAEAVWLRETSNESLYELPIITCDPGRKWREQEEKPSPTPRDFNTAFQPTAWIRISPEVEQPEEHEWPLPRPEEIPTPRAHLDESPLKRSSSFILGSPVNKAVSLVLERLDDFPENAKLAFLDAEFELQNLTPANRDLVHYLVWQEFASVCDVGPDLDSYKEETKLFLDMLFKNK